MSGISQKERVTRDEALADAIKIIEAYVPEDALGWANDGYDEHWPVKAEFLHRARAALSEPDALAAKEAECERLRETLKRAETYAVQVRDGEMRCTICGNSGPTPLSVTHASACPFFYARKNAALKEKP